MPTKMNSCKKTNLFFYMMTNHDIAKNLNMQSINKGNHLQVSWSNRYIHYYYLEYVQRYLKPTAVNSSLLLFSDDHMYFDLNMDNITYTSRPATIYQMSATSILFTQRGIKKILREILVHTTGQVQWCTLLVKINYLEKLNSEQTIGSMKSGAKRFQ